MNLSLSSIQKKEIGFIFVLAIIYVQKQLFMAANEFDWQVSEAENVAGLGQKIWRDLAHYNHNLNVIFPTITAAILFFGAWLVFHLLAVPKYFEGESKYKQALIYACLTVVLVFASVLIFKYFRLYTRHTHNQAEQILGMKVISIFRKLDVLTDTIGYTLFILLYEAIHQFLVYTYQLYQVQKQGKHLLLSFVLTSIIAFFLLVFAVNADLPQVLVESGEGLISNIALIISTCFFHYLIFTYVIPYVKQKSKTQIEAFMYVGLGLVVLFFFNHFMYSLIFRYIETHGPFVNSGDSRTRFYFEKLISIPSLLGLLTAGIRWYFFVENQQLQTAVFTKSAELSSLRSQINPHFLFNALNTLYSVALLENAEKTANGVQKLGDMMRFMLQENHQDRIPLSKEVTYLQNFIEIQQMRLADNKQIEIRINIQTPDREVFIAPMLLNPFVENAFKHGISLRNPSWIYITLTLDAKQLYFKVHNSLHAKPNNDPENSLGVGLDNVQKRLNLIYPNRHKLDIQQSEQDFFVSLTLGLW